MKAFRPRAGPKDLAQRVRNIQYMLDVEVERVTTVPEVNDRPVEVYQMVNDDIAMLATMAVSNINIRRFSVRSSNHGTQISFR